MADNMFGVGDSFNAPSETIYDRLLAQRMLLQQQRPDIAAQMPSIGANTPGERQYQARQQQAPQDLASGLQQMVGQVAQASTPQGAKPKDAKAVTSGIDEVLSYLDPLKPKQNYGPNIGKSLGMGDNAGGILGLGVQPIDVLAFALGAAITSKMPQDKAIATTMMMASLPKQFRDGQEANARKFIDDKLQAINAEIAGGNLGMRQLESGMRMKTLADTEAFISGLEKRLQTGQPLNDVEKQLYSIRAKRAGIDPNVIKEMFVKRDAASQLDALQQIKQVAEQQGLGSVRGDIQLEGGGKVTVGGGGGSGRPMTAGELADALATGRNTDRLADAGYNVTTPEGRAIVEKGLNERRKLEIERVGISRTNSERAQTALEMVRPEESKKLTALQELHRGANDMLGKYESSLKSHGGKMTADVQAAIQAATTSPDGFIGKTLQAMGQRYPGLTQQDFDFISRYASMQKFARGSLNDVGNLSNYERGIFQTMVGTPLDKPEVFRSRTHTAISDAQVAYDQEYRSLGTTRNLTQFPSALGASSAMTQPPKGAKVRDYTTLGK